MKALTIKNLLRIPEVLVWAALVAATVLTSFLGHQVGGVVMVGAILFIAFVKVHLIGMYFMEIHLAPLALRRIFNVYLVISFVVLNGFFLMA